MVQVDAVKTEECALARGKERCKGVREGEYERKGKGKKKRKGSEEKEIK